MEKRGGVPVGPIRRGRKDLVVDDLAMGAAVSAKSSGPRSLLIGRLEMFGQDLIVGNLNSTSPHRERDRGVHLVQTKVARIADLPGRNSLPLGKAS